MEHKLILGGEKYLPFARSRIKAMRATGMQHATQRFLMPDADIRVQIVAEESFIYIKSTLAMAGMDSGAVDVHSIFDASASTWQPGTLFETQYVAQYHGPFQLPESAQPPRLNSGSGSTGQFAGKLYFENRFVGRVPINGESAESFLPKKGIFHDPALQAKKRAGVLCPPSMFTGKCRFYVQALYGSHDAGEDFDLIDITTGERPAIRLNNRTTGQASVLLSTGCGVHLDEETGRHWLFTFTSGGKCFPLVAPAEIEAWRKYLINTADNPAALSVQDREHLEAYILSQSLPKGDGTDEDGIPYLSGSASNPYSMGYSWHWNWDGTRADAVTNTQYHQGGIYYGMESEWIRVTITKVGDRWQATETTVEGPTRWGVPRASWTITEPDFTTYTSLKSTPKFSNIVTGRAVFYAFYLRNELQTCEVNVSLNGGLTAGMRTMSPGYNSGYPGFDPEFMRYLGEQGGQWTFGDKDGWQIDENPHPEYHSASFSCGDLTLGPLDYGRTSSRLRNTISDKNLSGDWTAGQGAGEGFFLNYPIPYASWPNVHYGNENTYILNGLITNSSQTKVPDYKHRVGLESTTYSSRATIVVPFYDAEAVYIEGENEETSSWTYTVWHLYRWAGAKWKERTTVLPNGLPPELEFLTGGWDNGGIGHSGVQSTLSVSSNTDVRKSTSTALSVLKGHAGVVPATFTNLSQFHNNEVEVVNSAMYTLSGTRNGENAVAIADGHIEPVGTIDATLAAPVLVGWI